MWNHPHQTVCSQVTTSLQNPDRPIEAGLDGCRVVSGVAWCNVDLGQARGISGFVVSAGVAPGRDEPSRRRVVVERRRSRSSASSLRRTQDGDVCRHVVDLDTALGQQLLDVPIREGRAAPGRCARPASSARLDCHRRARRTQQCPATSDPNCELKSVPTVIQIGS
jgi:hypothetical protein